VLGTNENYTNTSRLYIVDGRGMNAPGGPFLKGWPIDVVSNRVLPVVGEGLPNAPAIADFDGDKVPEIMISGIASNLRIYGVDGKQFKGARIPDNQVEKYGANSKAQDAVSIVLISNGSLGDLDDDGSIDVVHGTAGSDAALAFATGGQRRDFEMHTSAWDAKTGKFKKGFPTLIEDWQFFMNPLIADIDGDNHVDVINASAGYFIHAWNVDGIEAKGFPKFTGGWIAAAPALGDIDGDGKLEMASITRNGWVFAWHTLGKTKGRIDWASFHHDSQNTGNYDTPLDIGRRSSGGGCSTVTPTTSVELGLFVLVLLGSALAWIGPGVRRRRRG
jgi:hypothetical protein